MNDITTTGILSLLDTNKEQRATFVSDVISRIEEGHADPIKIKLQVKKMEELIDSIQKNKRFKELFADEAAKHPKTFTMYGAEFQQKSGKSEYDYTTCNDEKWNSLQAKIDALVMQRKDRETFLKGIPAIGLDTVTEDGEVVKLYPPIKSPAADLIAVTLK